MIEYSLIQRCVLGLATMHRATGATRLIIGRIEGLLDFVRDGCWELLKQTFLTLHRSVEIESVSEALIAEFWYVESNIPYRF